MTVQVQNATATRFRYFQVPARDAEWGLYVTTMGWGRVRAHEVYPPVEHPGAYTLDWERGRVLKEYQIISVTQGSGVLDTEQARHRVHKGDVILLTPGLWHRYRPNAETGWYESWIGFNGFLAEHIAKTKFFVPERRVVHLRPESSLKSEFRAAAGLVRQSPLGMQPLLAAQVMTMLAKMHAATLPMTRRSDREDHVMERALAVLQTRNAVSLDTLAAELGVSYSWFRRTFREQVGMSPHQYRLHLQATQAQALLRATDLSVREIAVRSGFQTEQYFCRLFKRHTGRTPLEFRRKIQA